MICKKCGNEIKEGNLFCTNCGTSINGNTNQNKEPIKIKLSTFLILVVAIAVIFIFSVVIFGKKNNTNQSIINNDTEPKDVTVVENESNIVKLETDNVEETFGDTYDDTTHLLEQIYAKYPELEGKDGIICTNDNNEFWLLDENGKKMYFTNIEGFEAQLADCPSANAILNGKTNSSSQTIQSNQSINENDTSSNKIDSSNSEEKVKNKYYISYYDLIGKSKEDVEKYLSQRGLTANFIIQDEKIPYPDNKVGTFDTESYELEKTNNWYEEGENVSINVKKYVASPVFEARIGYSSNITIDYNNKRLSLTGKVGKHSTQDLFSYLDVNKAKTQYAGNKVASGGFSLFVNNKEVQLSSPHTFNNEKQITFKIIAPYLCTSDFEIIGENILVFERTISIEQFYNQLSNAGGYLSWDMLNLFN